MSSQLIDRVLELTNLERAKAGLKPLTLNNQLAQAAQGHSDNMAADDFFSHTGADGSDLGDRVRDSGYQYLRTGENIAAGQQTAEGVVSGWMNSPGHRANILNPNFTEIGIGYEFLENDRGSVNYNHYWTQVFGTPSGNSSSSSNEQPTPVSESTDATIPIEENNSLEPESADSLTVDKPSLDSPNTTGANTPKPVQEPELIPEEIKVTNDEASPTKSPVIKSGDLESIIEKTEYLMGQEGSQNKDYSIDQLENLMIVGEQDSVTFSSSGSKSLDNSQFSLSNSNSFTSFIDLGENQWLGNSSFDPSNYESIITEHLSELDLNSQQQIAETIKSLF
jgi:hypothetical protein